MCFVIRKKKAEVDGRHGRILHVRLTEEQMAQIFVEKPHVLRAYKVGRGGGGWG